MDHQHTDGFGLGEVQAHRYWIRQAYIGEYESLILQAWRWYPGHPDRCNIERPLFVQLVVNTDFAKTHRRLLSIRREHSRKAAMSAMHHTLVLTPPMPLNNTTMTRRKLRTTLQKVGPQRYLPVSLSSGTSADPCYSRSLPQFASIEQQYDFTKAWTPSSGRTSCQVNGRTSYH